MPTQLNIQAIKEQAQRVRKDCPELFDYLVRRDQATADLTRAIMESIPRPDDVPTVQIPFIDVLVTLAAPKHKCPICEDEDALWLTPKMRAKLCQACKHGIYLLHTGVGALVD